MPTYGYRCQACGTDFDAVQRMTDPAEASCPSCGGAGKRLFFPVGITFRGQGFYKTDSRASSSTPPASGETAAANGTSKEAANGSSSKDSGTTTTSPPPAAPKSSPGPAAPAG